MSLFWIRSAIPIFVQVQIIVHGLMLYGLPCLGKVCANVSSYSKLFGSNLKADVVRRGYEIAAIDESYDNLPILLSRNETELIHNISSSKSLGCSVLLGLYTSRECLIAGPLLKNQDLIAISPSCAHERIQEYATFIYSAVPPLSTFGDSISKFVMDRSNSKAVVLYQPTDIFSSSLLRHLKNKIKTQMTEILVEHDGNISLENLNLLKKRFHSGDVFVLLTYPLISYQILEQINFSKETLKHSVLIGSPAWIYDSTPMSKASKLNLMQFDKVLVPVVRTHDFLNSKLRERVFPKDQAIALEIPFSSYDVTRLALKCDKAATTGGSSFSKKRFLKCLTEKEIKGLTGTFKFSEKSAFANRSVQLVPFKVR